MQIKEKDMKMQHNDSNEKKTACNGRAKLCARLLAVQAVYEISQNKMPVEKVLKDYVDNRSAGEIEGQKIEEPDKELFLKVARGVSNSLADLEEMLVCNMEKKSKLGGAEGGTGADSKNCADKENNGGIEAGYRAVNKSVEPLLKSILLCGIYEITNHPDIDYPIIINDYLDVTHAFYEHGEVALVNAVLDGLAEVIRK